MLRWSIMIIVVLALNNVYAFKDSIVVKVVQSNQSFMRDNLDTAISSNHFKVHFTSGTQASYADSVLCRAEKVYNTLITINQWTEPLSDEERGGNEKTDIYIYPAPYTGYLLENQAVMIAEYNETYDREEAAGYIVMRDNLSLQNGDLNTIVAREYARLILIGYSFVDTYKDFVRFWFNSNCSMLMALEVDGLMSSYPGQPAPGYYFQQLFTSSNGDDPISRVHWGINTG